MANRRSNLSWSQVARSQAAGARQPSSSTGSSTQSPPWRAHNNTQNGTDQPEEDFPPLSTPLQRPRQRPQPIPQRPRQPPQPTPQRPRQPPQPTPQFQGTPQRPPPAQQTHQGRRRQKPARPPRQSRWARQQLLQQLRPQPFAPHGANMATVTTPYVAPMAYPIDVMAPAYVGVGVGVGMQQPYSFFGPPQLQAMDPVHYYGAHQAARHHRHTSHTPSRSSPRPSSTTSSSSTTTQSSASSAAEAPESSPSPTDPLAPEQVARGFEPSHCDEVVDKWSQVFQERIETDEEFLAQAQANKYGVTVSASADFGRVPVLDVFPMPMYAERADNERMTLTSTERAAVDDLKSTDLDSTEVPLGYGDDDDEYDHTEEVNGTGGSEDAAVDEQKSAEDSSEVVAPDADDEQDSHGTEERPRMRTYTIRNDSSSVVLMRDVCAIPQSPQFITARTPFLLAPGQSTDIPVLCYKRQARGLARQWVAFVFSVADDSVSALSWTTKTFVIARRNVAVNVDLTEEEQTLSIESLPFYPDTLRAIWDTKSYEVRDTAPPPLPILDAVMRPQSRRIDGEIAQAFDIMTLGGLKVSKEEKALFMGSVKDQIEKQLRGATQTARHFIRLAVLLDVEELQRGHDVKEFDLYFTHLHAVPSLYEVRRASSSSSAQIRMKYYRWPRLRSPNHGCYEIKVLGVGERRPAVDIGDFVLLRDARQPTVDLVCSVYDVGQDSIIVHVPGLDDAPNVQSMEFHVRFVHQGTMFLYAAHALWQLQCREKAALMLLPTRQSLPHTSRHTRHKYRFREAISHSVNSEQQQAIEHIVNGCSGAAPFILFGPPGTGKTLTIAEALLQLLAYVEPSVVHQTGDSANKPRAGNDARAVVLVCTPSDYSADILVGRLAPFLDTTHLLRLNSPHRYTPVTHTVGKFCTYSDITNVFRVPLCRQVKKYRVIVSTCVVAMELVRLGIPPGHFTHIFFDESSQATEPETCIPLLLAGPSTQVVLAGDHKQLGARLQSTVAAELGLSRSMQERLMSMPLYQESAFAISPVKVKLLRNYRSHPALIELPSRLFYKNQLIAAADQLITHSMIGWPHLPNRNVPILFHGIVGNDVYEPEGSSFYNMAEVRLVADIIEKLLPQHKAGARASRRGQSHARPSSSSANDDEKKVEPPSAGFDVSVEDIGVIAPYRKQVQKIRQYLRSKGLRAVRVGTVEDYQGREEKIIIVSTVLSRNRDVVSADANVEDSRVGVLRNPKRFNVAVTRAKALNIIVGNPHVLKGNENWRALLLFCMRRNAYRGVDVGVLSSFLSS